MPERDLQPAKIQSRRFGSPIKTCSMRRARQQALVRPSTRPTIILRQSKLFPTDKGAYQGVVLLEISSVLRAVSVRAEMVHGRFRITEIVLISSSS